MLKSALMYKYDIIFPMIERKITYPQEAAQEFESASRIEIAKSLAFLMFDAVVRAPEFRETAHSMGAKAELASGEDLPGGYLDFIRGNIHYQIGEFDRSEEYFRMYLTRIGYGKKLHRSGDLSHTSQVELVFDKESHRVIEGGFSRRLGSGTRTEGDGKFISNTPQTAREIRQVIGEFRLNGKRLIRPQARLLKLF